MVYKIVVIRREREREVHNTNFRILRECSHITSSAEGGGGFQKMTLDDGGEGGGFMVR